MSDLRYKVSPTLGTVQTVLERNQFQNPINSRAAPRKPRPSKSRKKLLDFKVMNPGKTH